MATQKNEVSTQVEDKIDVAAVETAVTSGVLVGLLDKDKVKNLRKELGERSFFVSDSASAEEGGKTAFEKCSEYVAIVAEKTENFCGLPFKVREGDAKDGLIGDAKQICLATVGVRDKATSTNGFKAIVAFEAPLVGDFLTDESEAAKNWIAKLIEREATDVAFGGLRAALTVGELEVAVSGMPSTVGNIVTTSRESTGLDTDVFDAMWQAFRVAVLRAKMPKVEAALPAKPDIIKSIRSAAYAKANPKCAVLENAGLFVKIANAMIQLAPDFKDKEGKPMNLDASVMQDWIDNRDDLIIGYSEPTVTADDLANIEF